MSKALAGIESTAESKGERVSDILIINGRVVDGDGPRTADVRINGESIVEVGRDLARSAKWILDAEGRLILPGAIDVHVHPVYLDDLGASSIAAAHGGVTTLIHFAYAKPGQGLLETVRRLREEGEAGSVLDFALHGGIFDAASQAEEIPKVVEAGVTTFKMFMTYAKLGWMTDDYQLMRVLDILGRVGGMGMVHAENGLATDYLQDKFLAEERDPRESFEATRPAGFEAEAIRRAIALAQVAGCPLYIPHVSARVAMEEIARAKGRGRRVFGETCPQYLTLTNEDLLKKGPLLKIGPPLRSPDDRDALWEGLADGTLDTVASDHAPKRKTIGDDFFDAPYGSPQIETTLPLLLDGVAEGRLTLPRLIEVLCEAPARIFGLYPKKGALQPGSDADLVIVDPDEVWAIRRSNQHSNATYSPYEGREVRGRVHTTMQRGEVVVEDGALKASPGRGRFLPTQVAAGTAG